MSLLLLSRQAVSLRLAECTAVTAIVAALLKKHLIIGENPYLAIVGIANQILY